MAYGGGNHITPSQPYEPKSTPATGSIWSIIVITGFFIGLITIFIILCLKRRHQIRRMTIEALEAYSASAANTERSTSIAGGSSTGGTNREVLASIPVFVYSSESHENRLECSVCLTEFKEKEKGRQLPACRHGFHTECIYKWFESHVTCPLCRSAVDQDDIESSTSYSENLIVSAPTNDNP